MLQYSSEGILYCLLPLLPAKEPGEMCILRADFANLTQRPLNTEGTKDAEDTEQLFNPLCLLRLCVLCVRVFLAPSMA